MDFLRHDVPGRVRRAIRYIRTPFIIALTLCLAIAFHWAWAGVLDSDLAERLRAATTVDEQIAVIVEFRIQVDPAAAAAGIPESDRTARATAVLRALRARASASQAAVRSVLEQRQAQGSVTRIKSYWLANAIAVTATPEVIRELAAHVDVAVVHLDRTVQLPPVTPAHAEPAVNAVEWNIAKIRAPLVWQFLNNRGEGTVVGIIDTGFDPAHPDLQNWRGDWLDTVQGLSGPYDDNGHGSHVTGTIVGGNAGGTDIGVAPNAEFISCKAFNRVGGGFTSDILDCMQWMTDPDGNPATADFPDAVNNSWGESSGCFTTYQQAVRIWWVLGIFPGFSAGNSGPGPQTGGSPGVYSESFATGATDIDDVIAEFSSRGPSSCDQTIFPEVSAPGVNVRSARPGGGYQSLNGTSMAAPHVSGCVALLRSTHPDLPVAWIWFLLRRSAVDLGTSGPDNDYGAGRLDCLVPAFVAGFIP